MSEFTVCDDDFLIRIRPVRDEDDYWTGNVEVSVASPSPKVVAPEEIENINMFIEILLSSIHVMQENEEFAEAVSQYVQENFDDDELDILVDFEDDEKVTVEYGENNVIKLNFNTDTKGNA